MTWATLWFFAPNLILCIVALLALRRQTASHKLAIAKLEALKRALEALDDPGESIDRVPRARPQHDLVQQAETKVQSQLRSIDTLLRRR